MSFAAQDIVRFLQQNPEFFNQYADTLAQISVPDAHGGRAVSLPERQMATLREQVRRLEGKLAELIRFGEENDALLSKTHRLVLALAGAPDTGTVLRVLYAHLGGDFAVPHVAVRLWNADHMGGDAAAAEFAPTDEASRRFAATLKHPYCGPDSQGSASAWFGERGAQVRSLAIVSLRRGAEVFGMLVLGSEEAQRFYPEMGTLYLERIGEVAATALARTLNVAVR